MRSIAAIARHLLGLFIDDSGFAAAILVWAVAAAALSGSLGIAMPWRGPLIFLGFALLLVWTCLRRAARR